MGKCKYTIQDLRDFAEARGGKCLSDEYVDTQYKYKWSDSEGRVGGLNAVE